MSGLLELAFYGMSSRTALDKYAGGREGLPCLRREGGSGPLQGSSQGDDPGDHGRYSQACAYVWATRLKDLSKCTTFVICERPQGGVFGGQTR